MKIVVEIHRETIVFVDFNDTGVSERENIVQRTYGKRKTDGSQITVPVCKKTIVQNLIIRGTVNNVHRPIGVGPIVNRAANRIHAARVYDLVLVRPVGRP